MKVGDRVEIHGEIAVIGVSRDGGVLYVIEHPSGGVGVFREVDLVLRGDVSEEMPIGSILWSTRVRNCFRRVDIETIGGVLRLGRSGLLSIPNFGQGSLREVELRLRERGFRLGD